MNPFYKNFLGLLIIGIFFMSGQSFSTIVNITVGPGGSFSFNPAVAQATVGDTIRWTWASSTHDVTSTSVPGGANSFASGVHNTGFVFTYIIQVAGTYNYVCTVHPGMNGSISASPSSISQENNIVPGAYELKQNYPNPFNPETNIKFSLPANSNVKLSVINLVGQEVVKLVDQSLPAGNYVVDFNAVGLNSGAYFYKLIAGEFTAVRKMLLIK
jgi:plastocyanin